MDWYLLAKFLHVTFAIIWLGGGLVMVLLGTRAEHANDEKDLIANVLKVAWLGGRLFVPASLLTLIFGALAVWQGQAWSDLWIILGLVGFATTFGVGITMLKPRADRIAADHKSNGSTPSVLDQSRDILQLAKFDFILLFTVVFDMVMKPAASDTWVLLVMAAAVILGAVTYVVPLVRAAPRRA